MGGRTKKSHRRKEVIMCAAKTMGMYNQLGMRLHRQGQNQAALTLLGLALRQSLKMRVPMHEAKIRNNMALVLAACGRTHLAQRILARALRLVVRKVGVENRFYRLLHANFIAIGGQDAPGGKDLGELPVSLPLTEPVTTLARLAA
jgi:hypothetical protein